MAEVVTATSEQSERGKKEKEGFVQKEPRLFKFLPDSDLPAG